MGVGGGVCLTPPSGGLCRGPPPPHPTTAPLPVCVAFDPRGCQQHAEDLHGVYGRRLPRLSPEPYERTSATPPYRTSNFLLRSCFSIPSEHILWQRLIEPPSTPGLYVSPPRCGPSGGPDGPTFGLLGIPNNHVHFFYSRVVMVPAVEVPPTPHTFGYKGGGRGLRHPSPTFGPSKLRETDVHLFLK